MSCPACGNELTPQKVNHITLQVCDGGCGGLWLNWFDLETFDQLQPPAMEPVAIHLDENRKFNPPLQLCCPHCTHLVMNRRFIPVIDDVLVDECPSCGGIWLSADELNEIREQLENEGADWQIGAAYTPKTDAESGDTRQAQRDRRFMNACHFLCSSRQITQHQTH